MYSPSNSEHWFKEYILDFTDEDCYNDDTIRLPTVDPGHFTDLRQGWKDGRRFRDLQGPV
jgi:hypothetical protein